jgi:pyridoxine 5-phosphate synthase
MRATHQRLYINIDHVATLRQARRADEPDPVAAADHCERAGADGITAHLREDRRHIQDDDVRRLAGTVRTVLNLEMALTEEMLGIAVSLHPFQVTFVPERREEITTEGGLDLSRQHPKLRETIRRLEEAGSRVSLFIDPDLSTIDAAKDLGVPAIELHTGRYANSWRGGSAAADELRRAARHAADMGLFVHGGHGLTYENVAPVAAIPEIEELNIGHSVVSRSVMVGMLRAVAEMRQAMG